jgi:hypothetical protein
MTAGRVALNMAFEVTIKLNTTSGVNFQEPSQSHPLMTFWRSKKLSDFIEFRISEFRIRDTELYWYTK